MYNNVRVLPQLGFVDAVKLAFSRLSDFSGRSRRSEFWWWMMLVLIANEVLGLLLPQNQWYQAAEGTLVMLFGLSVTARRLHDMGQSAWWVYISYALGIVCSFYPPVVMPGFMEDFLELQQYGQPDLNDMVALAETYMSQLMVFYLIAIAWLLSSLVVIVMVFMDSKMTANKYGPSPKYVA